MFHKHAKAYNMRAVLLETSMKTAKELIDDLTDDGVTQTEIAVATGIPQATISRIQTGSIADTKTSNWRRINAYHFRHFLTKNCDGHESWRHGLAH